MMYLSRAGAADIRLHEGFVDHYYLDAVGVGTIGIGFTWASSAFRQWWGMVKANKPFGPGSTMTRGEAEEVLIFISNAEYGSYVNKFLEHKVAVPQHVFDGMTSVVFNCGPGALEWKWAQAIAEGDFQKGAKLLETTATKAGGRTLAGLITRRRDEAELIRNGIYRSGIATGVSMPTDKDKSDDDGLLELGERGQAVASMQARLSQLGYYQGNIDGVFGRGTDQAVREFQAASKLTVDGVAGPKTLKAMEA